MAAHDASKAVRASVTTVPSFLKQNVLMYGVIRRQDVDKRGLTIGCKTAMVSNRTAITLQRVSDRLRPSQIALPKHISQRRHSAGFCAPEGHIKQFVEEVSGQTKVYWPSQSGETANQKRYEVIVGDQVKKPIHCPFRRDVGADIQVIFASFRSAFVFQGKRPLAAIVPHGHDSVVVLSVAVVGKLVSGVNLRVIHPSDQLLRALKRQMDLVCLLYTSPSPRDG